MAEQETIAAVATAAGRGGIGIVRLAGPRAKEIALGLLQIGGAGELKSGRARFARVMDGAEVADEAVVTFLRAPNSYTGDDVVEIAAHGSPVLLEWMLGQMVAGGARVARPGEFTERAFLSGRLDLAQAEAVRDLIEAQTMEQARVAARQMGGALSREVRPVKQALVELIGELEAGIDFAEDDVSVMGAEEIGRRIGAVAAPLKKMVESFAYGRVVREGVTLAIVGRPNAGKSSLFNRLVRRERAIVTASAGTTRDLVTERMVLEEAGERGGILVELVDTAGLRAASDEAEAMGVAKSREALADADLVLVVLDATTELNDEERGLLGDETLRGRAVVVRNKVDLLAGEEASGGRAKNTKNDFDGRKEEAGREILETSAATGAGVEELRAHLLARVRGTAELAATPVTNLRQQEAVRAAVGALDAAAVGVEEGVPHEMLLLDCYSALRALDELTGETTADDVLALIFSKFCIGK